MELDDLRRQWQQPNLAQTPPAFDDAALIRLLARGSGSPIAKMRRNAWLEIGFVVVCLVGCIGIAVMARDVYYLFAAAWLGLICLLSGFYYRLKLSVLRSLGDIGGRAVREQVTQQLRSLRSLVHLYYQATLWSVPASLTVSIVFVGGHMVQTMAGPKLLVSLGLLGLAYGLMGTLIYFGMRWATRWYLQRLYGQHLDRLEANLCELGDEASA